MDGVVDILFSYDNAVPPSDKVHSVMLSKERMCLAVPAGHPNAGLKEITRAQIPKYFGDLDFCLLDPVEFEQPNRPELEQLPVFTDNWLTKLSGPFADFDSLMLMVEAGLIVTCFSEASMIRRSSRVSMIPLYERVDGALVPCTIGMGPFWTEKNTNPLIQAFLDLL